MSVILGQRIVSPPSEELTDGCMCRVKNFEKNLAKVVAFGSMAEMNNKLDEIEGVSDETQPPKKKSRLAGKENKHKNPKTKTKPPKRRPQKKTESGRSVSYTHLTLPTIYSV